jgi:hypothetical protein
MYLLLGRVGGQLLEAAGQMARCNSSVHKGPDIRA